MTQNGSKWEKQRVKRSIRFGQVRRQYVKDRNMRNKSSFLGGLNKKMRLLKRRCLSRVKRAPPKKPTAPPFGKCKNRFGPPPMGGFLWLPSKTLGPTAAPSSGHTEVFEDAAWKGLWRKPQVDVLALLRFQAIRLLRFLAFLFFVLVGVWPWVKKVPKTEPWHPEEAPG